MNKGRLLAFSIASVAAGCAPLLSEEPGRVYYPSEVVQNIELLDGRQIRVAGYLRLGTESMALWDSQQHFQDAERREANDGDPIWNHCITAYYNFSIERQFQDANGSMIEAAGTIGIYRDESTGIDLWGCNVVHVTLHHLNR